MMLIRDGFMTNQNWRASIFFGPFMRDKGRCFKVPEQSVQGVGLSF